MADGGLNLAEGVTGGGVLMAVGAALKWLADAWVKSRRSPEQKARDQADLDRLSIEMAGGLMKGMREDLDSLRKVVTELQASHAECEERCTALTGEIRKLQAANEAQGRLLSKLKDPAATNIGGSVEGAIFEMSGGKIEDVSGRPLVQEEPL